MAEGFGRAFDEHGAQGAAAQRPLGVEGFEHVALLLGLVDRRQLLVRPLLRVDIALDLALVVLQDGVDLFGVLPGLLVCATGERERQAAG